MIDITISIISHGHDKLVNNLLKKIDLYIKNVSIILTNNYGDPNVFEIPKGLNVKIINNTQIKGFGENHNDAFKLSNTKYFCILNPDIDFNINPITPLIKIAESNPSIGILTVASIDSNNVIQDNLREFPTFFSLFKKLFITTANNYKLNNGLTYNDWVSGQFMFFSSELYKEINGFNTKYFLYYEDVDICRRVKKINKTIALYSNICIIHNARRDSHKSFRFFKIHIESMFKFLFSN